jgi:hypothetical protein
MMTLKEVIHLHSPSRQSQMTVDSKRSCFQGCACAEGFNNFHRAKELNFTKAEVFQKAHKSPTQWPAKTKPMDFALDSDLEKRIDGNAICQRLSTEQRMSPQGIKPPPISHLE